MKGKKMCESESRLGASDYFLIISISKHFSRKLRFLQSIHFPISITTNQIVLKHSFIQNGILFWVVIEKICVLWERNYTILKISIIQWICESTCTHKMSIYLESDWHQYFKHFDNYHVTYCFPHRRDLCQTIFLNI
jgi:hypothetical protein